MRVQLAASWLDEPAESSLVPATGGPEQLALMCDGHRGNRAHADKIEGGRKAALTVTD
jgi:hypothetical protein